MQTMSRTILVRNLAISLGIGIHAHERQAPQRLLVSVEVEVAAPKGGGEDRIDATLDYDRICDFIRALPGRGHVELQETVAASVLEFALSLPGALSAVVETRKPDIFDDCDFVGVRITGRA